MKEKASSTAREASEFIHSVAWMGLMDCMLIKKFKDTSGNKAH
jgi:hypothetical protein